VIAWRVFREGLGVAVRVPLVAGNWKMQKDLRGAVELARGLAEALRAEPAPGVEVAVFPAFPFLLPVRHALEGTGIGLGAQNCHEEAEGAFTGEVSADMVRSTGAAYAIVGHSERRRIFREPDETLNLKVRAALGSGLKPIFCVGETIEQREAGRTEAVVSTQLALGLDGITGREAEPLAIAYEPVWAIGTGRNATPAQAQEVHAFIRGYVANRFNEALAGAMRILYGGSVKASNAAEILAGRDVDGALVGGASLEAKGFSEIARAAARAARAKSG